MTHNNLQKKVMTLMGNYTNIKVNVVSTNGVRGVSDLLFCVEGLFIAIEVKVGKDTLRPQQIKFLQEVNNMGGLGLVVHENTYTLLEHYMVNRPHTKPDNKLLPPKEIKAMEFKV